MKRLAMLLNVVLVLALLVALVPASGASASAEKVRLLVQFAPGKAATVQDALVRIKGEVHYRFDDLNTIAVSVPQAALNGILNNPNVVMVEEDVARYFVDIMPSSVEAPVMAAGQTVPYGIDMVQARDVWDANRDGQIDAGAPTGSNRKLCIIDSGLYTGHEDLSGVNVTGGYPSGWNQDGLGHGTHVAGTIAAVNNALGVVGVTPGTVNLYIVRVFGDTGEWIYASTLIDAANRCASAGANIISMSLGGAKSSSTERRGFDTLYSKGILSIAAAGNDGNTAYSYPASYTSVMSVAAIDSNKVVADFSQQNNQVEIAAPGVGVLSTLPFVDANSLTVSGVTYVANHVEFAGRGTASGALVNGGLCDSAGAWSGKVVLCERGVVSFYDKVINVQNGGGAAAVLYNNEPGNFFGTLGEGYSSNIPAISLSQEDGQFLVANRLGQTATVDSRLTIPASGYEAWDGTSMATPHVSAVAALIWSAVPTATNADIRSAMTSTALDLGAAGRDNAYGYGLVQAKAALDALTGGGGGGGDSVHVADLDGSASWINTTYWKATVTVTVRDQDGVAVANAVVNGTWSGGFSGAGTCTTNASGQCQVVSGQIRKNKANTIFTVTAVTAAGFTYDAGANSDPDGDSSGTAITVLKP